MNTETADAASEEHFEFEAGAYMERQRWDQARQVIAKGLERFPDNERLTYLGAHIDFVHDQNDAAMQTVRQVLARNPSHYGARLLLASIHTDNEAYAEAETALIDVLKDYPQDPDVYGRYAKLMLTTFHIDKAIRLAQEGVRHDPEDSRCLLVLVLAELVLGKNVQSNSESLQRLMLAHPDSNSVAVALIQTLLARGKTKPALEIAQQLFRANPQSKEMLDLVKDLKAQSHWSMLPLYPMQRWGWGAAIGITLVGLTGVRVAQAHLPVEITAVIAFSWLGYVIYSWVWPKLIRKFV
jgi:tetratricopeptide (TPR) repeat protein